MQRTLNTILGIVLLSLSIVPVVTSAQEGSAFSLTPVVVHEKAKAREILKKTLTLTNNSNRPFNLYASVNNLDTQVGLQEFKVLSETDLSKSLANWIEITRGVIELAPGETRQVPYLVHVNLRAQPGLYHAKITFSEGPTRVDAEDSAYKSDLAITLEVLDDAKEHLQLGTFSPDKPFFSGSDASFSYTLENNGNRALSPRGELRIFNRKGEEVAAIEVNGDGKVLEPSTTDQLATAWGSAKRLGKYKAFLDVEYGETQRGSVQDTVYFWVFPWKEVLVIFVILAIATILGTLYLHNKYVRKPRHQYAHLNHQIASHSAHAEPAKAPEKKPTRSLFKKKAQKQEATPEPLVQKPAERQQRRAPLASRAPSESYKVALGKRSQKTSVKSTPGHVVTLTSRKK